MHELSIAQSILSIAEKAAPRQNGSVITAVNLHIGALSGIEPDALTFAFSVLRDGTVLKDAALAIEIIPGKAHCLDCGNVFPYNFYGETCSECDSIQLEIVQGKEMKVTSISVEE